MKLIQKYKNPTPLIWKKVGDAILLVSAGLTGAVMGLPIDEHSKLWFNFYVVIFGIVGKLITNFATEKDGTV